MSSLPPPPAGSSPINQQSVNAESEKSFSVAFWLALALGLVGADRFYLGKSWTGAFKLLTGGGYGLWWLYDLVLLLRGATLDAKGRPLAGHPDSVAPFAIVLIVVVAIIIGLFVFAVVFGEPVV